MYMGSVAADILLAYEDICTIFGVLQTSAMAQIKFMRVQR